MRLPWVRGYVESVCRLTDRVLIVVGWCLDPSEEARITVMQGGRAMAGAARLVRYSRPDVVDRPHPSGIVAVAQLQEPLASGSFDRIGVEAGAVSFGASASGAKAGRAVVDEVRARLGWLDAAARERIVAALLEPLATSEGRAALGGVVAALTEVLAADESPLSTDGSAAAAGIDRLLRTGENAFYAKGWVDRSRPAQLWLRSPEGHRVSLLDRLCRAGEYAGRIDALLPGARDAFVAHVELSTPSVLVKGWRLEIVDVDGAVTRCPVPAPESDSDAVRGSILADMALVHLSRPALVESHIHPALSRMQRSIDGSPAIENVFDYGRIPTHPGVSLVICLYRRLDFLEHQLVQFARDAELHGAEIVFVLDSPELAGALCDTALELYELYRLAFRVVTLNRNGGYAAANNAGVSVASGRLLLLCNSDVFPRSGWLGAMARFHDSIPDPGAIGPKLLFEDETIQHAGMYFDRSPASRVWWASHYHKGLHRTLPAANVAREVPAVSGACLMIDRELYRRHGGFRPCYVLGDYEDSDLCLRLKASGRHNWYFPDVELYHLENQSYDWSRRQHATRYNAWLHTHLWDETLAATMQQFADASAVTPD